MKFFHLSDLHIGKQLHRYNLKEDQQVILKEVITYAKELRPDAIVIAGDIYDKSVPSAEAVNVFDEFLTDLSEYLSLFLPKTGLCRSFLQWSMRCPYTEPLAVTFDCKIIEADISRLRMVAISFSNCGICPMFANSSSKHRT